MLGFTRREVAAILISEQGALTVAALPLGVALGFALTTYIARAFEGENQRFPLVVDASTYLGGIAIVLLAGLLAALLMRRRLNRMDLIAVLKTRE